MTPERSGVLARVADIAVAVPVAHPLRVAIDGITGSGKTTFANELAVVIRNLGRPCLRVTMDGFHNPRAVRYRRGRESAEGYYEDAYDFASLRRVLLDPLGPAGDRRYRTAVIDLEHDAPVHQPAISASPELIVIVDGSFLQRPELWGDWDVVVFLRSDFAAARDRGAARDAEILGSPDEARRLYDTRYHAAARTYVDAVDPEGSADVVVDHDDPMRPAIVRAAADLTSVQPHLRRTRAFFGARAGAWDERFPDDDAVYADAIAELCPPPGGVVVDLGCGTGRALAHLRRAAGADGTTIGIDVTEPMVRVAAAKELSLPGGLVVGDATRLPFGDRSVDAFFGAGLVTHVPDARSLLCELARAARPGCRLAFFHPIGRAALARRHQRELRSDELLDPSVLPGVLADSGWRLERMDDAEHRYFALAGLAA